MDKFEEERIIADITGIYPSHYSKHSKNRFHNPYRIDDKPGCYFEVDKFAHIRLMDWGHKDYNGMDVYDIACCSVLGHRVNGPEDFKAAAKAITDKGYVVKKTAPRKYDYSNILLSSKIEVSYKPRPIQPRDLAFWSPVGITTTQLITDHVYPTAQYTIDRGESKTIITPEYPTYAMVFKSGNIKLYNPLDPNKENKWHGYSEGDDVFLDNDSCGDLQFLVEGYRDARVIKNEGYEVKGLQSTTLYPGKEVFAKWQDSFRLNVILFDPDFAGQQNAQILLKNIASYGFDSYIAVNYPALVRQYIDEKGKVDITRVRKVGGKQAVKQILNMIINRI